MDKEKIIAGAKLILEGIGEDLEREGLIETPERIARMYEEIFSGLGKDAEEILSKTFEVENNDLVIEKDITYFSMCESCRTFKVSKNSRIICKKTTAARKIKQ